MFSYSAKVYKYQCFGYDYDTGTILRRLLFITEKQKPIFVFVQEAV